MLAEQVPFSSRECEVDKHQCKVAFDLPAEVHYKIRVSINLFCFNLEPGVSTHIALRYNALSVAAKGLSHRLI